MLYETLDNAAYSRASDVIFMLAVENSFLNWPIFFMMLTAFIQLQDFEQMLDDMESGVEADNVVSNHMVLF